MFYTSFIIFTIIKVEQRYRAALARLPPQLRARHEHYVKTEKGGVWLWESIVPHLEREPPRSAAASASSSSSSSSSVSNEPIFNLSDARKAIAVLRHTWAVVAPLLSLPPALPVLGPVLLAALRAARPRAAFAASQLEADGSKYLRSLNTLRAAVI